MSTPEQSWVIEEFRLSSPVDEFEDFCRCELDRLRATNPNFDDSIHRQAAELVSRRLRRQETGGAA